VIRSFRDKRTAALWKGERVPAFGGFRDKAERKLAILDAAESEDNLAGLPGNRLEALKGDRKGQYSIRINDQWRICFRWKDGDAYEVEIVDYH
jgi:proteic killer suppression protein